MVQPILNDFYYSWLIGCDQLYFWSGCQFYWLNRLGWTDFDNVDK